VLEGEGQGLEEREPLGDAHGARSQGVSGQLTAK
jgi:hypothetical protein